MKRAIILWIMKRMMLRERPSKHNGDWKNGLKWTIVLIWRIRFWDKVDNFHIFEGRFAGLHAKFLTSCIFSGMKDELTLFSVVIAHYMSASNGASSPNIFTIKIFRPWIEPLLYYPIPPDYPWGDSASEHLDNGGACRISWCATTLQEVINP